jgi:DNA replicative helicase MCM subunit Mcm2 (Cdc46/Mcm family)
MKQSWFNKIRQGAINHGVLIEGMVHKASPIKSDNTWRKGTCPKCGSKNGFVFRSHINGQVYILFCQKCNKYSWKFKGEGPVEPVSSKKCRAMTARKNRCRHNAKHLNGLCDIHENMRQEGGHVLTIEDKLLY